MIVYIVAAIIIIVGISLVSYMTIDEKKRETQRNLEVSKSPKLSRKERTRRDRSEEQSWEQKQLPAWTFLNIGSTFYWPPLDHYQDPGEVEAEIEEVIFPEQVEKALNTISCSIHNDRDSTTQNSSMLKQCTIKNLKDYHLEIQRTEEQSLNLRVKTATAIQLLECRFWMGNLSGAFHKYHQDGELWVKAELEMGALNGEFILTHPNGVPKISGIYENGVRHGTFSLFDDNGDAYQGVTFAPGKLRLEAVYAVDKVTSVRQISEDGKESTILDKPDDIQIFDDLQKHLCFP